MARRADFPGECPRCNQSVQGQMVVRRKGVWIHASCAPGADDE